MNNSFAYHGVREVHRNEDALDAAALGGVHVELVPTRLKAFIEGRVAAAR